MNPTRWAILIGINEYHPSLGSLNYCVNDCRRIEEALTGGTDPFLPENVLVMTDEDADEGKQPTYTNILKTLSSELSRIKEEDTVFLFFAGHGRVVKGDLRVIPKDANQQTLVTTSIRSRHILDLLGDCEAWQKVFVIDACHSGTGPRDVTTTMQGEALDALSRGDGLYTITSCSEGELSHEWEEKEQGVFSYFLAEALAGGAGDSEDGRLTMDDIFSYVDSRVKGWARDKQLDQTPWRYNVGRDIVLRGSGEGAPAKRTSRPSPAPARREEDSSDEHRRRVEARNSIIQGDNLLEAGDPVTARSCYQKALELVPGFAPALLSLGKAELGAGNIEAGIRFFSEAIAADPDMADLRRQRAKALMSLKKYDEAIKDYTEVIRISAISAGKPLADAYYFRGWAYFKSEELDKAIADLDRAIQIRPTSAKFFNRRGWIYLEGKGLLDQALSDFNEAIRIRPGSSQAVLNTGHTLRRMGEHEGVIKLYSLFLEGVETKGRKLQKNSLLHKVYFNRGNCFFHGGENLRGMGDRAKRLREYSLAEKDYSEAIRLKSDYLKAYQNRAVVRSHLGNIEGANRDQDMIRKLRRS